MKFMLLEVRVKLWLFFGNIDVVWDGVFCWIVFQIGFYIVNSRKNLKLRIIILEKENGLYIFKYLYDILIY